jgi:L-ribulose-5-phosphate 4-epimerase
MDIPNIGTTHSDYFHKDIPCTAAMTPGQIEGQYELETGNVIVERFDGINPDHTPGVLVRNHGPFSWGKTPADAVYNSKVLEQCAHMAYISFTLNPQTGMNPGLIEKHYNRKHGPGAYYGQKKKQ